MYTQEQQVTVGIVVPVLVLAGLSFVLRIYARLQSAAKLWYDDYWMTGVMVVAMGMCINDFIGLAFGSGIHSSQLDPATIMTFMKNLYAYMLLWSVAVWGVKVGIMLFYWRVFRTRKFRVGWWIVFGLVTGIFASCFCTFVFQCVPVNGFWIWTVDTCIDRTTFYFVSGVLNVVSDLAVLLLPLPLVWGLKTSRNKKWSLSFLFLLGVFVCIASVFRLLSIRAIDPQDFTYSNVAGGIWSTVEVMVGFICANLPSIRPLVLKAFRIRGSSGQDYSSDLSGGQHPGKNSRRPRGTGTWTTRVPKKSSASARMSRVAAEETMKHAAQPDNVSDEIELTKTESSLRALGEDGGPPRFGAIRVKTETEVGWEPALGGWDAELGSSRGGGSVQITGMAA